MPEKNTPEAFPTKPVYPLNEWCARRGCGRTFAYAEIKAGRLKARKQGGRTVVTHEDDEDYTANLPPLNLSNEAA